MSEEAIRSLMGWNVTPASRAPRSSVARLQEAAAEARAALSKFNEVLEPRKGRW